VRAIGLDVGTKTIGVAVSDALGIAAHPVRTLTRQGVAKDAAALTELARSLGAATAVVGLPYELDGSEQRPARLARQIGDALAAAGLHVSYMDERFSSVDATRRLIDAGVGRDRRKEVVDQAAAMLILEGWLAARSR
jgi:putative Holliday junction resolvase